VDLDLFTSDAPGSLVPISGVDPRHGEWNHFAFVPHPLPQESPTLSAATYRVIANARAALAALDSTASRLPNPSIFRRPALQTEAQSTSALEGTYAPLTEVLIADEDRPPSMDIREVLNYIWMADSAFQWIADKRPLTVSMIEELQAILIKGTRSQGTSAGSIRNHQVVIGKRKTVQIDDLPVHAARFVPSPPGLDLKANLQNLLDWMGNRRISRDMDPVVAAALAHYQFEALHPFHDGNGRIGRLLIVIHLLLQQVLSEPTLTVSPWLEARRSDYYDHLLSVSTHADWNSFIQFFATGLESSAQMTRDKMIALVAVQDDLKERVRKSKLRADTAQALVDYAVSQATFTVRRVERELKVSYGRANTLVSQLIELDILRPVSRSDAVSRRFYAPRVFEILTNEQPTTAPTRA
jgi:Fic family protein